MKKKEILEELKKKDQMTADKKSQKMLQKTEIR